MAENSSGIKWRPLIIGIAITLAIYIILASASQGGENALLGFLIGAIVVGFLIEAKITRILVHGALLGVIAAIISLIILVIQLVISGLISAFPINSLLISLGILFVYDLIVSLVGSVFGNVARVEYKKS